MIEIVRWSDSYADDYVNLSVEWLEKYVRVEAADKAILYHPHEAVLDSGGMILFARDGDVNVGTVTLIRKDEHTFELAKLAVTEVYRSRHIGDQLVRAALAFAEEKGAERIVLFTNSRLRPAIHLYEKHGFRHVAMEENEYEESDMKMMLDLRAAQT
ncbi:MAG: GNAT family N-acetyltransferase [Coriobacteriales bacterium]